MGVKILVQDFCGLFTEVTPFPSEMRKGKHHCCSRCQQVPGRVGWGAAAYVSQPVLAQKTQQSCPGPLTPLGSPAPWQGAAGTATTQPHRALDSASGFTPDLPAGLLHGSTATFLCWGTKAEAGAEPAASPAAPPRLGAQPSPAQSSWLWSPSVPAAAWQDPCPRSLQHSSVG